MAVGKEERDLLVSLESGDFTYFVDVLEPTPPFNAMAAVILTNNTLNTSKNKDSDKTLTKYRLNDMTTVVGAFNKSDVENLDSFYDLFASADHTLDTVTNQMEEDGGLGFNVDDSIVAGVVTVVASGYASLGSSVIATGKAGLTRDNELTKSNKVGRKTVTVSNLHYDKVNYTSPGIARTDKIKEQLNSIYRTTGITIEGNDAYNFIVGGKGNDSIYGGNKGDDTLEGGAGKDTLTGGHDTLTAEIVDRVNKYFPEADAAYFQKIEKYSNTFIVRGYSPTIPAYANKGHVNETTITDFEEQDQIKVDTGFIELGEIKNNGTLRLIIKNNNLINKNGKEVPTNLNKGTVNILKGVGQKIKIIDQNDNFSCQVYGAKSITVGADDGQTINTVWNPSVVTIDSSERNTSVGLVGNSKDNLIFSGLGDNTLATGSGKDTIIYYGGNDVITDYTEGKDIIKLQDNNAIESIDIVDSDSNNAQDIIYTLTDGNSIRVNNAVTITYKNKKPIYSYKKITFVKDDYTLKGSGSNLTLTITDAYIKKTKNTKINTAEISPAINIVDDSNVGKKNGLEIISDGLIKGGKGADTLTGGSGNDTLTGGAGNDLFVYTAGHDIITDYVVADKISLEADQTVVSSSLDKKNVILVMSNGGRLQINNGKGKAITINDEKIIYGNSLATLVNSTGGEVNVSNNGLIKTVDASSAKKAVTINGNDKDNVLKGGTVADSLNGGEGNDTLIGGKGNDTLNGNEGNDSLVGGAGVDILNGGEGNNTLTGGAGNDKFVYDGGKDIITDYAAGDVISLPSGTNYTWTISKKDVIFDLGDGTITVKNGKGKKITINNSTQTYKTNSTDSRVAAYAEFDQNVVNETWFTADDNIAGNDLDSILQTNSIDYSTETQTDTNIFTDIDSDLVTSTIESKKIYQSQSLNRS
ncbi:MAG: hypothetical protein IJ728_09470 [Selenomonadaceae bacterium]|nr:hypothetical protein [Selenomonadaceae bacterium]